MHYCVVTIFLLLGMTRAPCVRMSSAKRAADLRMWLEDPQNAALVAQEFNSTSRFARLTDVSKMLPSIFGAL